MSACPVGKLIGLGWAASWTPGEPVPPWVLLSRPLLEVAVLAAWRLSPGLPVTATLPVYGWHGAGVLWAGLEWAWSGVLFMVPRDAPPEAVRAVRHLPRVLRRAASGVEPSWRVVSALLRALQPVTPRPCADPDTSWEVALMTVGLLRLMRDDSHLAARAWVLLYVRLGRVIAPDCPGGLPQAYRMLGLIVLGLRLPD